MVQSVTSGEVDPNSYSCQNHHPDQTSAFRLEGPSMPRTMKPDAPIDLVPLPLASVLLADGCQWCQAYRSQCDRLQQQEARQVGQAVEQKFQNGAENCFSYDFSEWHSISSADVGCDFVAAFK